MLLLKQLFAFPMFFTVVWLAWVLGHQRGIDAMAMLFLGLVLIAISAWLWGRTQAHLAHSRTQKMRQVGIALLFFVLGLALAWPYGQANPTEVAPLLSEPTSVSVESGRPATDSSVRQLLSNEKLKSGVWLPYSETLLNEARHQGHPVFVDFTAAWCLSCQVNKRATLHANSVMEAFKQQNVITIEADWTNGDPIITEALARLHRNAVPVYVVYPANGGAPELLPEVLTPSLVIQALNRAAQKDTPKQ
jgi:thiol:disulfide interchange protein DsbD